MSPVERQHKILEILCLRRHETSDNLAKEFHVSQRTIFRDLEALMCSYPIETICGRFGGGVRVAEGFHLSSAFLNEKQIDLLKGLSENLEGEDLAILDSILVQFASS